MDDNGTIDREEMVQIVKAMISMAGDENAEQDAKERVAKIFDLMDTVNIWLWYKIFITPRDMAIIYTGQDQKTQRV